jgi:hypothetical protein
VAAPDGTALDGLRAFTEMYRAHAAAEDRLAFPAAQALIDAEAQRAMGQEMALRRGVPPPRVPDRT